MLPLPIRLREILIIACLSGWGGLAVADDLETLIECKDLADDKLRLDCFDKRVRQILAVEQPGASPAASTVAPTPAATVTPGPAPAAGAETETMRAPGVLSTNASDATRPAAETAAGFGLETTQAYLQERLDSISARIDGEFSGWDGSTYFPLDNGQTWKQVGSGRAVFSASSPKVTIRRAAHGTYRLSVEGLNRTVRVKRIK